MKCSILKQFYQREGFAFLTSNEIFFVDNLIADKASEKSYSHIFFFQYVLEDSRKMYKRIDLKSIKEIQKRRFIGRKSGLELFLLNGKSILLNFEVIEERD